MALNGQFPSTMLVNLGWPEADHLRLVPDAAASLNRLAVAFAQHFGKPLYLSDAYRTLAEQKRLKITKGAFAAQPGTSNHGWGLAIDMASRINVDGSDEHRWMEANGPYFGWINPWWAENYIPRDGQHEPWHWEFHFDLDRSATVTIPTIAPLEALKPTFQGVLMFIAQSIQDGTQWLVGPGFCHRLTDPKQATPYQAALKTVLLDNGDIGQIQAVSAAVNSYTR